MTTCNLAHLDIPPYALSCLSEECLMLGGGGGSSKTGVPNSLICLALESDGKELKSRPMVEYDTNKTCAQHHPIMTADTFCTDSHAAVLACGMGKDLTLFTIHQQQQNSCKTPEKTQNDKHTKPAARKRHHSKNQKATTPKKDRLKQDGTNSTSSSTSESSMSLKHLSTTSTDSSDANFLKAVRFSFDGSLVATGGTSKILKVWKYPSMELKHTLKGHKGEIDDLAFCPNSDKMVSVSRDGGAILWDVDAGKNRGDLIWTERDDIMKKYRYRACRFGLVNGDMKKTKLYTLHIPKVQQRRPAPGYVLMWDTAKYIPDRIRNAGTEILCALTVSSDGNFLGIGTIEGSVDIYISFSLQRLKHVSGVHQSFVTGLSFLPCGRSSRHELLQNSDTALVSISVDRKVNLIRVPLRWMTSVWVAIVLAFVGVLAAMIGLSKLGF